MKSTVSITTLFVLCTWSLHLTAQQEPFPTLFWNNLIQSNPAMTGAVYKHSANVVWRDYWMNRSIPDIPYQTTLWANYAYKLDKINSGVGASYRYDAMGHLKQNTALLSYAYHIPVKNLFLSIGASGGIGTLEQDFSELNTADPLPSFKYDPVFTADFGVALRSEKWNVGVSVTQLNSPVFRFSNPATAFQLSPHFWLFADYRFNIGEKWNLTPRVQFLTNQARMTSNIQLVAAWKENLWFGAGIKNVFLHSNRFIICPLVGYDIKGKFRIGYAANISNTPDAFMHNHMTHEVVLSFLLK